MRTVENGSRIRWSTIDEKTIQRAVIQLTNTRVIIDQEDIGALRSAFARNHCVFLPGLLAPGLLTFLASRLDQQPWVRRTHEGIGVDDVLNDALAVGLLDFVTNTPAFLDAICHISGCADVVLFKGSVYRLMPDSVDHDSWHSDVVESRNTRLVGMSINLGARGYSGAHCKFARQNRQRLYLRSPTPGGATQPCSRYPAI